MSKPGSVSGNSFHRQRAQWARALGSEEGDHGACRRRSLTLLPGPLRTLGLRHRLDQPSSLALRVHAWEWESVSGHQGHHCCWHQVPGMGCPGAPQTQHFHSRHKSTSRSGKKRKSLRWDSVSPFADQSLQTELGLGPSESAWTDLWCGVEEGRLGEIPGDWAYSAIGRSTISTGCRGGSFLGAVSSL